MKRIPLWLPYLQGVREVKKGLWEFLYHGGKELIRLEAIQSILIYGDSDVQFALTQLEAIARSGVPMVIYRRNLA